MKAARLLLCAALAFTSASPVLAHGGGCRKASPPGQCCHLQTSTQLVHCH